MIKFSTDKTTFTSILNSVILGMSFYIDSAITDRTNVNYADELPLYILRDVGLDSASNSITFFFEGNVEKTIDLNVYSISQSHSVPYEFYFTNKNDKNDYIIIIFKA